MSALDEFLHEIECYDMKWYAEIGGERAKAELTQLRADLAEAKHVIELGLNVHGMTSRRQKFELAAADWLWR